MNYRNLYTAAISVLSLIVATPVLAQLESTSPIAPTAPGPTRTLPEILPCDASGKPVGPAIKDQIVKVPTPPGDKSDQDALVAPPSGTPRDPGIAITPNESGTPGNLPRCTLPSPPRSK